MSVCLFIIKEISILTTCRHHQFLIQRSFTSQKGIGVNDLHCDAVSVKINTSDISRGFIQVEVAGVDPHDKGAWGFEHITHFKGAKGNIRTLPLEWKEQLQNKKKKNWVTSKIVTKL